MSSNEEVLDNWNIRSEDLQQQASPHANVFQTIRAPNLVSPHHYLPQLQPTLPTSNSAQHLEPMQPLSNNITVDSTPSAPAKSSSYTVSKPSSSLLGLQPQQPPTAQAPLDSAKLEEKNQIMNKLQQLTNQVSSFMKSVDARLTTLEKMTQQIIISQSQMNRFVESLRNLPQQVQEAVKASAPPPAPVAVPVVHAPVVHTPTPMPLHMSNLYSLDNFTPKPRPNEDADLELARKLQEEFDREIKQSSSPPKKTVEYPWVQTPTPQPTPSTVEKCPICGVSQPTARDLEQHVQKHFDEQEGQLESHDPKDDDNKEKVGFWDRLFGAKGQQTDYEDEKDKKPFAGQPQRPTPNVGKPQVPLTAYPQNFYYPGGPYAVAPPQLMYRPGAPGQPQLYPPQLMPGQPYGYPGDPQMQGLYGMQQQQQQQQPPN